MAKPMRSFRITPEATAALYKIMQSGISRTDAINDALVFYAEGFEEDRPPQHWLEEAEKKWRNDNPK